MSEDIYELLRVFMDRLPAGNIRERIAPKRGLT